MRVCLQVLLAVLMVLSLPAPSSFAEPRVVVTIKPIHSLVAGVMAGIGKPYLMVKGAASPHTYTLKPSDASALQKAGLVFRIGGAFDGFLESAINNGSAAEVVVLNDLDALNRLKYRQGKAWGTADHADHKVGHGGHDHGHSASDQGAIDPHIWLDPDNAILMVAAIAKTIGLHDRRNFLTYAQNAAAIAARIKEMKADITAKLKPVGGRPFLVFHDAFQYFEHAFGVTAAGAVSLGEARAAGARRIRALRRQITSQKIVCLFTEPQFEPKIVATLTEGTSVRTGALDPIGAAITAGPLAYFKLMNSNAKALADCLK